MGNYAHTHIGCYVKVTPQKLSTNKPKAICQNNHSEHEWLHKTPAFCSKCGTSIEVVEHVESYMTTSPYDLLPSEFEDYFYPANDCDGVWVFEGPSFLEKFDENAHRTFDRYTQTGEYPISLDNIQNAIQDFAADKTVKAMFEFMHREFGQHSAKALYGAVHYWA